jgi:enterochelin esterase family protein
VEIRKRLTLNPAIQTAKNAKNAKAKGVEPERPFTGWVNRAFALIRSVFASFPYFEVPNAFFRFTVLNATQKERSRLFIPRVAGDRFMHPPSISLEAEYTLSLYTPPGYEQDGPRCWLMIAFDGGSTVRDVTLDNLLAAGKIPPLVVVGVQNISSQTRQRDLDCSDEFASFLAEELVPWARKTYRVYDDPAHTIVGGVSLGGKMAAYCGLKHSGVFGKVLSQSGSFLTAARQESPTPLWEGEAPGLLAVQFVQSPRLPLEFYLEAGRYETTLAFSPLLEARRLRDVLKAKGYPVTYSEFVGDHNEVCWRGSFADAIMALTAKR